MGPLSRVIAHHASPVTLVVELGVLALLLAVFGSIWLRERRRRVDLMRRIPEVHE